jgi:hypothetical protein
MTLCAKSCDKSWCPFNKEGECLFSDDEDDCIIDPMEPDTEVFRCSVGATKCRTVRP